MPCGQKTKTFKKKKKQYCRKLNKDFKYGPHQKKKKNLEKKSGKYLKITKDI